MIPLISDSLKVLVVDDSIVNGQVLKAMLNKMGHHAILAASGEEALAMFGEHKPDMVLMDVSMPRMSGFEAVRELRRRNGQWFPIIFISAHTDNHYVVEGLRAGGDDYLFKPVSREILQAKMQLFHIRLEQNQRLLDYRDHMEDEADTARDFIKQFTAMDKINDPLVRYFFKAAENFSGDLIAVARKPDNSLHVLLADSAGHGLTAALAVIPITQPFYQMTAKGFELPAIAREINRRVRDYLPLPRFVAAVMLSLNPETGAIQVWNGGCPPVLLLNPDGTEVLHGFRSRQLPFGVVPPAEFDAGLEYYTLADKPGNLLLCSDGVTEIRMEDGRNFGHDGVLSRAQQTEGETLFDRVSGAVVQQLQGQSPDDDIALMMVSWQPPEPEPPASEWSHTLRTKADMHHCLADGQEVCGYDKTGNMSWEFSLTLTAQQLKRLDVVPFLLSITGQIEGGKAQGKLFLVLSELFNNALDHGVLKLDSSLKNKPEDGMEMYFSERAARLSELDQGEIIMHLERLDCSPCGCLKIRIKDSGDGFDYTRRLSTDIRDSQQRHGRGIALLDSMCNRLRYSGNGSEVLAYVVLDAH